MNKLVNGLINVIFYPLLAVILAVAILFICGIKPYITMSGSMEQEIQTGSVCFVDTKADYNEMQEGDIIAYQTAAGGLVTHRVIFVTEEGLETKGDNNDMSDGISTTSSNFRGETLFSVPYVGYILKTLQQPVIFAILLVVVVGIVLYGLVDYHYARKEEADHEQKH